MSMTDKETATSLFDECVVLRARVTQLEAALENIAKSDRCEYYDRKETARQALEGSN